MYRVRGVPANPDVPSSTARLFLALYPPAATRQALLDHSAAWEWPAAARRTPPDRLHITLHFLGAVLTVRLDELKDALRVPFEPFELQLTTPQVWPGGLAVLCAQAVPPALQALHASLAERLAALAVPVEERALRVHVTLARQAKGARRPSGAQPVHWPARDGYALVQSLQGGKGYQALQRFG